VTVTADHTGPPEADARVIEQSWTQPERFAAIFERYFSQVHQYLAGRVGGKTADDLAAEVFVVAFAQRQRYDLARGCARPWLLVSGARARPTAAGGNTFTPLPPSVQSFQSHSPAW
jgi:RNA polymerase sigma-70 factor, ECF subfamily